MYAPEICTGRCQQFNVTRERGDRPPLTDVTDTIVISLLLPPMSSEALLLFARQEEGFYKSGDRNPNGWRRVDPRSPGRRFKGGGSIRPPRGHMCSTRPKTAKFLPFHCFCVVAAAYAPDRQFPGRAPPLAYEEIQRETAEPPGARHKVSVMSATATGRCYREDVTYA